LGHSKEREFFEQHTYYNSAQVVATIAEAVVFNYFSLSQQQQGAFANEIQKSPSDFPASMAKMVRVCVSLNDKKMIRLTLQLRKYILRYQPVIDAKNGFF
jgi:sensor c-di-GMP phosphodiesterase-like protein